MRRVVIETPFAGDIPRNLKYLRSCMRDCLLRGEAPFASHAIYTQPGVLDDGDPAYRKLGMNAGFAWRIVAEATVVYTDLGITLGMDLGIKHAEALADQQRGHTVEYRKLGEGWEERYDSCVADFKTRWP